MHTGCTTLKVGRWSITGVSQAGQYTTIVLNELKICFDIGIITNESIYCDKVLISHGHVDHCNDYFKHYRIRRLRKMLPPPVYLIHPIMETPMRNSAEAQFNMEKGLIGIPLPKDYIQIKPLQEPYEFNRCQHSTFYIRGYPMTHSIPSYGYTVISQTPKLKTEYIGLPSKEIKKLRKNNTDIFYTKRVIEIAYTGDTTIDGVLSEPYFLNAEVLLIECTIIDDQINREETRRRGHIHIQDIVDNWKCFKNNYIVLFHLSPRYTRKPVHELVKKALEVTSPEFRSKVQLLWPKSYSKEPTVL
uniref:Beta-lactamase superfamily domain protein n=1 Tax=Marseillevirus LCMAC201 TaxID=2506605 RepID=A0A481YX42_9VIRU|nr:MAG: beta-lactamase superfamily domain protein [Marseillevirus LCMAC201]